MAVAQPTSGGLNEQRLFAAASPAGFGWASSLGSPEPYIPARFHLEIAKGVVDVAEGRLDVLIPQVPVQHGKTTTASVLGSAWFLGIHPERFVVAVSYSSEFAADRIGRQARDQLERYGKQFFGVTVDPRSSARDRWNTTAGGGLATFGIEKGVAGRRADLLAVDDPYPGMREASSKAFRDLCWDRYRFELASRLAPGAGQIHIMSRWGEDDHIARMVKLCEESGLRYRVLDFPALAICSVCQDFGIDRVNACGHGVRDSLGRLPGEALWPEVRDRAFLLQRRKEVGTRAFESLFQGRPRPDGGLMFGREWFRYYDLLPDRIVLRGERIHAVPLNQCRKFQFVDPATSTDPTAARFRIGTFLMTPERELIVLDMVGGTLGAPLAKKLVRQQFLLHRPNVIGIEQNGMGQVFVQDLIADGLPIKGLKADKDKVSRAASAQIIYENLRAYHPVSAPWLREFEDELLAFPGGAYKDQVDVLSMAAYAVSLEAARTGPPQGIRIG